VALEDAKNQQTLAGFAVKFDANPVMISEWEIELEEYMSAVF
jgi:hypothetical protein